jgi:hypothetical protein
MVEMTMLTFVNSTSEVFTSAEATSFTVIASASLLVELSILKDGVLGSKVRAVFVIALLS